MYEYLYIFLFINNSYLLVFDCEELLESSIKSIRDNVDYIVVVYQKISNFGQKCNPFLEKLLNDLVQRKLVDEIVLYKPKKFSVEERRELLSPKPLQKEVAGLDIRCIEDQFFNELSKRDIGRQKCLENGCTHFMSMDSDEYYLDEQFKEAKKLILENDYDSTFCYMRTFFREPIYEYLPVDELNSVPFIYKCTKDLKFKLASGYNFIVVDPTRRIEGIAKPYIFKRSELEMYHMSLVRKNMRQKVNNVSNKANYINHSDFLERWNNWKIEDGPIHPHEIMSKYFKDMAIRENYFNIDIMNQCYVCCQSYDLKRCSRCKSIRYCSEVCQSYDWKNHKEECKKIEKK